MARELKGILVVIPAHNEEQRIADCLRSVAASTANLHELHPQLQVQVTLLLDSCTDGTERTARNTGCKGAMLRILAAQFRNVGSSRALGIEYALQSFSDTADPARLWIACTDADTRVPEHWLSGFAEAYAAGAEVVTGTVEPDRDEVPQQIFANWHREYTLSAGHPHIHGANLGFSAAAYLRAGGFAPLSAGEDVELVQRLRNHGLEVVATDRLHAVTSGRLSGRLKGGFADYLSELTQAQMGSRGSTPSNASC
ncbi:glycosyltransferase [Glutamicibacter sp.]|uniref:glycosyltransferase n=1 Tax=Glutamicibacter sp. TaxID=1931995 RepID=UPI0028BD3108|nr:glycosyltransferase [Glutamicibacter sp.]